MQHYWNNCELLNNECEQQKNLETVGRKKNEQIKLNKVGGTQANRRCGGDSSKASLQCNGSRH